MSDRGEVAFEWDGSRDDEGRPLAGPAYRLAQPRQHILSFFPERNSIPNFSFSKGAAERNLAILKEILEGALRLLIEAAGACDDDVSREVNQIVTLIFFITQNKKFTEDLIKVVIATLNVVTKNDFDDEYRVLAKKMASHSSAMMSALSRAMYDLDKATRESIACATQDINDGAVPLRALENDRPVDDEELIGEEGLIDEEDFYSGAKYKDRSLKIINFLPYYLDSELHRNSEKNLRVVCSWILNSLAKTLYDNPCSHSKAVVKSAEKLLDGLFAMFFSSQDKQSMIHLMEISVATMNHLNGHLSSEDYNQFANKMQQHSSLSLRVLGGLMLALGGVMMACGAAIALGLAAPVVGVAAVTGAGVAAAGLALTSVGVTFFAKKSVSKQVVESMKELNNKIYDMSSWRSSSSSM